MLMGKDMEGWWLYPALLTIIGGYMVAVGVGMGLSAWVNVPAGALVGAMVVWMTWDGYTLRKFCIERAKEREQTNK